MPADVRMTMQLDVDLSTEDLTNYVQQFDYAVSFTVGAYLEAVIVGYSYGDAEDKAYDLIDGLDEQFPEYDANNKSVFFTA